MRRTRPMRLHAAIEIPLTRGLVTMIDYPDLTKVMGYNWYAIERGETFYAARNGWKNGRRVTVLMHRLLLDAPEQMQVDHRDHDGLNNRRSNLRLATHTQNRANSRCPSTYKGVVERHGRYVAQIAGERRHLGMFDTAEEAARAYDHAALERYGEYALTNAMIREREAQEARR